MDMELFHVGVLSSENNFKKTFLFPDYFFYSYYETEI